MNVLWYVAVAASVLAVVPAVLFFVNLRLYRVPPLPSTDTLAEPPGVSVLIPARNEEAGIGACVEAALASTGVTLEVIVLDDHSCDATHEIVAGIARRDPRLRVAAAPPLPPGWCGKQHACHALAGLARQPLLAFIDADVRLAPDGLARAAAFQRGSGAALVSGVPRQETGTLLERLLIPLIHFLLLGFLPVARMRASTLPAYGAGCGQLFLTPREAYERAGGHAAIRRSLHDGITLPRAYRRAGLTTDLFDATPVATCRMYRSAGEVWAGLAKNATEGMASAGAILPWTVLLLGGQVLPGAILLGALPGGLGDPTVAWAAAACGAGVAASYAVRLAAAARFKQSVIGALLHPVGVILLLAVQWFSLLRQIAGGSPSWRGRSYAAPARGAGSTLPGAGPA